MLNKELLMTVGEDIGPVLSIYFTPGNQVNATVFVPLSSGDIAAVTEQEAESKTFKFSELDLTTSIRLKYNALMATFTFKNLIEYNPNMHAIDVNYLYLKVEDVTQSASIVIE